MELHRLALTGGLATLVEKKSRRMELALYCISRAMESWGQCLVEWGLVNPTYLPPRLDILMFSLAVGSITHCYADDEGQHRDVFRSKYLNVLDFIFGNSGTLLAGPATQGMAEKLCQLPTVTGPGRHSLPVKDMRMCLCGRAGLQDS